MVKVAAIQMESLPKQVESNLQKAIKMMEQAKDLGAEIVVLPELWSSGYHLNRQEFMDLAKSTKDILATFQNLAHKWEIVMIVPYVEKKEDSLYISLGVIEKTGELLRTYDKSFLWGKEQEIFTPGERLYSPITTSIGKIGVLICYDIEFPEPSRLLALQGANLIIAPSVWSIGAQTRWDIQLPARALDNTVYVLGVNTIGQGSCGKSKLVAPNGDILSEAPTDKEHILIYDIDFSLIAETRMSIPYLEEYDSALIPGGKIG